ncbi:YoaK family protein [Sphingobacterium oryzagri]|uniref:YoaK family protein n=1 Tax=Sphingobacterium oryzagri TaxID=3025669 RepID=A0ABY7WEK3_9SPHI|nr:YoaK family protein [Sphingobacterium sp. KACC 22765]WDF67925.1 YoaK family protein [Sphingobacterium sp. KACC 22765]
MLRKYSNHRTLEDNIKLGALTAFSAGMVNVASVTVFFAFTSNITGYYAVFAQELSKANWYQGAVVLLWILLFFLGSFLSNFVIIQGQGRWSRYISHAIPVMLEFISILFVGLYLDFFYTNSLQETEFLVAALLFAMGLQNGLTASISNSVVKTTHLTGLTTDLAILVSMFSKRENRQNKALVDKFHLLLTIMFSYVLGGIAGGIGYIFLENGTFYLTCAILLVIALYDYYKLTRIKHLFHLRRNKEEDSPA